MKINKKGLKLIKKFEGCKLETYMCPGGVATIGYGHTGKVDGKPLDINKPIKISKRKATKLLKSDLKRFEKAVSEIDKKYNYNFNRNEFSALVSFTYNLGEGCLKSVCGYGARNRYQIKKAMLLYDKANGKILPGLVKRRKEEFYLFETK